MTIAVFTHADGRGHVTPPGHPERVERLGAVEAAIESARARGLGLRQTESPPGNPEDVLRCHPRAYFDRIAASVPQAGWVQVDGDTFLSPGSLTAALRAVGGACAAVDSVLAGDAKAAFVAARPPGHHAETETAMGFCLFGTVAIAAKRALDHHGLSRVAVLDFDVHHGNGTQDLLWNEARVRFVSSHQMPLYPGTGAADETGAHGQITNLPLRAGSGGAGMRRAWEPALADLAAWRPELVLISAGFDAHERDPLGGLDWTTADFAHLTAAIGEMAGTAGIVSCLEGGYDLAALGDSVRAHLEALGKAAA